MYISFPKEHSSVLESKEPLPCTAGPTGFLLLSLLQGGKQLCQAEGSGDSVLWGRNTRSRDFNSQGLGVLMLTFKKMLSLLPY